MKPDSLSIPPAPQGHPGRSMASALPATFGMLALIWAGAWWFEFNQAIALAMTLVVLVVGLMAHGIATALASQQKHTPRSVPPPAPSRSSPIGADPSLHLPAELNGRRWSLEVFETIDAQRFAAVCETWFAWAGFDTRTESHRSDTGVDIWLHAAKMPGPVAMVRCRHWLDKPVGLQEMKDFMAAIAPFKSVHGTYTTTSTYTPEALQFAREHGIDAVDGRGLLRRIQTRTQQRQQALLAVAIDGRH